MTRDNVIVKITIKLFIFVGGFELRKLIGSSLSDEHILIKFEALKWDTSIYFGRPPPTPPTVNP